MIGAMKATSHEASDLVRLRRLARGEPKAVQRDRYRVVLLAAGGAAGRELTREQIACAVGRSRQFVDQWVGRYRRGGIDALAAKKQPGRAPRLSPRQKQQLRRDLDAGPQEGVDPRGVFFGQDIRQLIRRRFGKLYSLSGTYRLLHEMGYSWLCPRPHHPKGDPARQAAFKKKWSTGSTPSASGTPASVC
jgi:transposase